MSCAQLSILLNALKQVSTEVLSQFIVTEYNSMIRNTNIALLVNCNIACCQIIYDILSHCI